jgi:Putative Flp pilus-assembly TadE/G-like
MTHIPRQTQPARVVRGQALIIVAFSMVVLLGIGALVVDLGFSWIMRRHEQNAADPGAIAAARYIEDGDYGAMVRAACYYAKQNEFFVGDDDDCSTATVAGDLQVLWPPSGPHAGNFAGRPEMVLVVIRSQHPLFFGRIFGQDVATVATGAVAARETTSANSNSLVALDPTSCGAGHIHGNGDITIEPVENPETPGVPYDGGYVHVNSSCAGGTFDDACGSGGGAFKHGGNAGAELTAPHMYIHGTCQESGGSVTTPVTEGAPQIGDPLASLVGPRQDLYPAGQCPNNAGVYQTMTPTWDGCKVNRNTVTLTPGVYWGGWDFKGNGTVVTLQPGIYILAGGGISHAGQASINTVGDGSGNPARVLIFSTDNTMDPTCTPDQARCVQGQLKLSGQGDVEMWGLDSGPWRGLLIWQDREGSNCSAPIEITGQGALNLAGTIYAPCANVKINGNGDAVGTRLAVQVISWTWDVGGNGELIMPYDPNELYRITQRGLVH